MNIERLDHNGRGIGYIGNKITFVKNALPNEIVELGNLVEKKKYIEAELVSVNKKSDSRKDPECPYYNICGGCSIMHMNRELQNEFKKNKIQDILRKFADLDVNIDFVSNDNEFNYRDKVTLKVKNNKLGYFGSKTNNFVEIENCLLATDIINKKIEKLKLITDFKSCYEVSIRNVNSEKTAITFYLHNDKDIINYSDNEVVVNHIYKNKQSNINDEGKIIGKISSLQFYISPQAFFQININQTEKILKNVKKYLSGKGENLLDLYCGTGSIGIYMSDIFKTVLGIEICKPAILDAIKNAKLNNANNVEFFCGDTEKLIKNIDKNYDSLIVDPPRAGLTNNVINDIFRINPKNLIYISCDPITLSRDLKIIKEKYNIISITGYDMFPNTFHVETVCILEKIKDDNR